MKELRNSGLTLKEAKQCADIAMADIKNGFVSTGYYLKAIRDEHLWKGHGYKSFDAFLSANYEKDKSWASRCVSLYENFGMKVQPGEMPKLDPKYADYKVSQLIEMLSLSEEKREKITPKTLVREIREMKPKREKKVATVATSNTDKETEPEEEQNRDAYVKEQYRLQTSFLHSFAVWLIKNHKNWFLADYTNRVLRVDQSVPQLKAYLDASQSGFRSFGFPVNGDTYYVKLYDKGIEISHFTETGDMVIDGISEWFYLAASIQSVWNEVALEEVQEKEKGGIPNSGFNSNPTSCLYRKDYSCTVPDENRTVCGDGQNCANSCCWLCVFHSACELECNSSASREGKIPAYDAVWFVKEWAARVPEDLEIVLKVCRESSTNAERAKAVQKKISPYGAYILSSLEYNFSFHSFTGGIDFRIGKVTIHLKYGRFVQELIALYPDFKLNDEKEPKTVPERPEDVLKQEADNPKDALEDNQKELPEVSEDEVKDSLVLSAEKNCIKGLSPYENCVWLEKEPGAKTEEIIIDTEFKEIPQEEKLTPAYFLEREKGKLERLLRASEGIELKPGDIEVIERQKTIVAALACLVCDLETAELKKQLESEKPKQPELPVLKNNDQRAAFIDAYEAWPVWIETEKTGERYYRYDLPDCTSIVVKVYHAMLFDHKKAAVKWEDRFTEGYGKNEYYLLKEGKFFKDCETNRSVLIERLKEIQKKGNRNDEK